VLVHAHDGGIDHLHRRVVTGSQRIHDLVPDASPPPPNEGRCEPIRRANDGG
jgi:hypothetical protein